MKFTLKNSLILAQIDTMGAGLISLKRNGQELLWQPNDKEWNNRIALLFPVCGSLRENRFTYKGSSYDMEKHGYARHLEFDCQICSEHQLVFVHYSNESTRKIYPFRYVLKVTYTLHQNSLSVDYEATALDDDGLYCSVGAHPAFYCRNGIDHYTLKFSECENVRRILIKDALLSKKTILLLQNKQELPLSSELFQHGSIIFDYLKSKEVTLIDNISSESITIHRGLFEHLVIWSMPNSHFVCIEPWSGMYDTCESDFEITQKKNLNRLTKGQKIKRSFRITL